MNFSSKIILPDLPYEYDALMPYISKNTLFYHHDKHHAKVTLLIDVICFTALKRL